LKKWREKCPARAVHMNRDIESRFCLKLVLSVSYFVPRALIDIATCMYYSGIDSFTKKPVQIAKGCAIGRCSGR